MHELSLACEVIEIAKKNTIERNFTEISEICIEVGEVSGVEIDSFKFALESSRNDPMLRTTNFKIITVPSLAQCVECNVQKPARDFLDLCPACGGLTKLVAGKELKIRSITIKEN